MDEMKDKDVFILSLFDQYLFFNHFRTRIEYPFNQLKEELMKLMDAEDWRKEVEECEKEVEFINVKMEFLEQKVKSAGDKADEQVTLFLYHLIMN